MKAFFFSALVLVPAIVLGTGVAQAQTKQELVAEAQKAFAERDYTIAGIASAQRAADLYLQIAGMVMDQKEKAPFMVARAEALYFVGNASDENKVKMEKHWQGYELSHAAVAAFGVTDVTKADPSKLKSVLSAQELEILGEGLYYRGINLGQWGAANGVVQSLTKWPELRDTMQLIINLGLEGIHDFGANRTLGRGYFKIPAMLGGSQKKAKEYLTTAFEKTLNANKTFSINGYNNIYLAEVLLENGSEDRAIEILEAFVNADKSTFKIDNLPETLQAQKDAKKILADWK